MLGACYLTEWTSDLEDFYDLENEVMVYKNADELVARAEELLSQTEKRKKFRIAGQKRALGEHSIPATLSRIQKELGLEK